MRIHRFLKKLGLVVSLMLLIGLIVYDSSFHFNKSIVALKQQHQSAQRHWNLFYGQKYTYYNSPLRYQKDLKELQKLMDANTLVLSDKATSYYLASQLPVFVANIHRHHGVDYYWRDVLKNLRFCYLDNQEVLKDVKHFIEKQKQREEKWPFPEFKYIVLNQDHKNSNTALDCLSAKRGVKDSITKISSIIYQGEYLDLYEVL